MLLFYLRAVSSKTREKLNFSLLKEVEDNFCKSNVPSVFIFNTPKYDFPN